MNLHVFSDIYWKIRGKIRFYKELRAYYLKKPSDYIYDSYDRRIRMWEESELFDEKDRRLWKEVRAQALHHKH